MWETLSELELMINEKHTDVFYNGGFDPCEDPYDFIEVKEVSTYEITYE